MKSMKSENYYNQNAKEFYAGTVNVDMNEAYKPFLDIVKPGGHILDAGCGSGRDSLYFIRNGYKVTAMDASEAMVELASELTGQKVLMLRFQDISFKDEFDGIWARASLLHVNRIEINDVLSKLSQALRKDGIICASFKYGDAEGERDGRYFNCYDEAALELLLSRHTELEVVEIWKSQDARPDKKNEYWAGFLARKISAGADEG
ncbi:MAG: class I SAM-dependent methyltransferase [Bacteroidota bacterium]|nr:class I SAM-dependent methyltransferase [Bacteroidota bacterium]